MATIREYLELAAIRKLDKGVYRDKEVLVEDLTYLRNKAAELRNAFDTEGDFRVAAVPEEHAAGCDEELWFLNSMMS